MTPEDENGRPGRGDHQILATSDSTVSGFGQAGPAYAALGWPEPIPVNGKEPFMSGWTGGEYWDKVPDVALIHDWARAYPHQNTGLRHVGSCALDIDHGYSARNGRVKHGASTLAAMEEKLGHLPATFTSSARGQGNPSRQLHFRISPERELAMRANTEKVGMEARINADFGTLVTEVDGKIKRKGDIEVLWRKHRYSAVYPSIHPETATRYEWYDKAGNLMEFPPAFADLPELPEAWLDYMAPLKQENAFQVASTPVPDSLFVQPSQLFPGGDEKTPWTISQARARIAEHLESIRTTSQGNGQNGNLFLKTAQIFEFVPGAITEEEADAQIAEALTHVVHTRPCRNCPATVRSGKAKGLARPLEVIADPDSSAVEVAPANLPDAFWDARPALQMIRQAAYSRRRSPDAVLGSVLARVAAMADHRVRVDTGVGNPASLNFYAALIGASGDGKSSSGGIAESLIPGEIRTTSLGSGEGIAEAYMGTIALTKTDDITGEQVPDGNKKTKTQVRHNVLFELDEGAALLKVITGRQGVTIGETLRSGWSGERLGQQNGSVETTRLLPKGTYSMGLTIGFQESVAAGMFTDDETNVGTPQRFVYFPVVDPNQPRRAPEHPGVLPGWRPEGLFASAALDEPRVREMTMDADVMESIDEYAWLVSLGGSTPESTEARKRKEGANSHWPLTRIKLAGLLCLIDRRTHITQEDWELGGMIWNASCVVRSRILAYSQAQQERASADRAKQAHSRAKASEEGRREGATSRVERVVAMLQERFAKMPQWKRGDLRTALKLEWRGEFEAAIAVLVESGQVEARAEGRTTLYLYGE